ncbi:MAG: cobyrinate a,c-diamide synthase [Coriobacteriales bacterium]|jgi:cobyrinic acid a,c-diamide synthase|nr:cobyrinate a,c-diamide synthase [Coriobacteriales bacterium]
MLRAYRADRVLVSGTHSGCGKTTVTCALLKALKDRRARPSAFKCGPDYIDPMFHRRVIGVPSYNLDPFLSSPDQIRASLSAHADGVSVLEGAMGYYDGVGPSGEHSAHDVAKILAAPVVLVLDVGAMHNSAGAVLKGFAEYRSPRCIKGAVFNNVSAARYNELRAIAADVGVQSFGYLPRRREAVIESRHLGLVTADEIVGLEEKIALLGTLAEQCLDIDGILQLAAGAPALQASVPDIAPLGAARIAVAKDDAFCFRYEESLELLRALGCELAYFSPLHDESLPAEVSGLYLCGGYPELYAQALSENTPMLKAVKAAVCGGMPTIAECGGFLYLHDSLDGHPLAGVIHAAGYRTDALQRFGYATLHACADGLLCKGGDTIPVHEFHFYESTDCGAGFYAKPASGGPGVPCGHSSKTLYAGFPHVCLAGSPEFAERFVRAVLQYAAGGPLMTREAAADRCS